MSKAYLRTSALVALTLVATQPVATQPAAARPSGVVDGTPDAGTCAQYGYRLSEPRRVPIARNYAPTAVPRAAVRSKDPASEIAVTGARRPDAAVPPLPVPPVEHRIEEPRPPSQNFAPPPPPPPSSYQARLAPIARPDTERYPHAQANPIHQVAEEPVSTFSVDVDTASYANVRRFLNEDRRPPVDAVRVEELINYFDYSYAHPAERRTPFKPFVAVAPSPWSAQRQILQIGLQGYDLPSAQKPPLNLVFLVDTSGSMMPDDRLPLARRALNILIDQLRPEDRVAMVAYAGSTGVVLPPTEGREKLRMRCALAALESGGSTAGGAGLSLAYSLARQNFDPHAVNRIVLMTDGDFNVGVSNPEKLKDFVAAKRRDGVYLSVYGFGRGNYNETLMQALAQNGNGTGGYVDGLQEARKLFRDDFSRSVFPIADDVKIQVEFNPARVREYRLIGYETRMLAREDFNNDQVDAGEVGSGASVTALYEITPVGAKPSADALRYGKPVVAPRPAGGELAFLKIRYKLPGQARSELISRPIGGADAYASLAQAPEATRWAVAVAGFGQKLRDDPRVDTRFGWDSIGRLAQGARGADPYGLRSEFLQLVRNAGEARERALSD